MNYPNLKDSKIISVDIETYDPELLKKGPGVYRKDGNILGVSIATPEGFSEYYDIGHKGVDDKVASKNIVYLREVLSLDCPKLGANIMYDLDWIENWLGIKVNGDFHDVQFAEPLLDEYAFSYSLDNLAKKYLRKGKFKSEIQQFCDDKGLKGDPRQHLYMMPYELVRNYALVDAQEPLEIFKLQHEALKKDGLLDIYHMEVNLIPLLLQMRKVGVRVDYEKTIKTRHFLKQEFNKKEKEFDYKYDGANYNSTKQLAPIFDELGIVYPRTDKGNPSITQNFMKSIMEANTICKDIVGIKKLSRVISAVFDNVLIDGTVNNRIHTSFAPLKTDSKGTVSGRFSSFNPNLQQIPSKEENYVRECRSVFIPEENCDWVKLDYSQVEYRILAHFAQGERADELRERYNVDPTADYHQLVMDRTGFDRKIAKSLNFGIMYCMGVKTCSETFGWSMDDARAMINKYHNEAPYVKFTVNNVINAAKGRGYIKTILGRKARVSEDMKKHGKEYIMFNRLIQGSAADVMKKGMVDAYNKGIFNTITPHLFVHDELDGSAPRTKEGKEAIKELKHTMENCVKLRVPLRVDCESGSSWGELEEYKDD